MTVKESPHEEYDRGFSNGWDACAARAQPAQAEAVPPGYVLVPVEPTEAMCDAAMAYVYKYGFTRGDGPGSVYRAMIDAALAQQKGQP